MRVRLLPSPRFFLILIFFFIQHMASSLLPPGTAALIGHWFARKGKKIAREGIHRASSSATHFVTNKAAGLLQKAAHKGTTAVVNHILPAPPERASISREEARKNKLLPVRPYHDHSPHYGYGYGGYKKPVSPKYKKSYKEKKRY